MTDAPERIWAEFTEACSTVRDIDGEPWGTISFENFQVAIRRNTRADAVMALVEKWEGVAKIHSDPARIQIFEFCAAELRKLAEGV